MTKKRVVSIQELATILNTSVPTLYRWHQNGDIPIEKRKFGRSVGYLAKDVDAWLNGDLDQQETENTTEEKGSN